MSHSLGARVLKCRGIEQKRFYTRQKCSTVRSDQRTSRSTNAIDSYYTTFYRLSIVTFALGRTV